MECCFARSYPGREETGRGGGVGGRRRNGEWRRLEWGELERMGF